MLHRAYPYNLVSSGAQPTNKVLIVLATDVQKLLAIEKKKITISTFIPWTTWNEPQIASGESSD